MISKFQKQLLNEHLSQKVLLFLFWIFSNLEQLSIESYKLAPDHSRLISLLYSNILKGPWWRLSSCDEIPEVDNLYIPCSQGRDARQCLKPFPLGIGNSIQSKQQFMNKLEFLNTSLQTRWSAELIFFFFLSWCIYRRITWWSSPPALCEFLDSCQCAALT